MKVSFGFLRTCYLHEILGKINMLTQAVQVKSRGFSSLRDPMLMFTVVFPSSSLTSLGCLRRRDFRFYAHAIRRIIDERQAEGSSHLHDQRQRAVNGRPRKLLRHILIPRAVDAIRCLDILNSVYLKNLFIIRENT
jgi:hypothetical protein